MREYTSSYDGIREKVGFTKDACAAFASTALRGASVEVPYEPWAPSLPGHLKAVGWKRIDDPKSLRAGDLIFTRDERTERDGLTNHVYVFAGYARGKSAALAIDNRDAGYERNLGAGSYSPFWFAYRHP